MKKSTIEASLLLVDDDPAIVQMLSRILSDYSTVRFATSGADALRLSREAPPDLILLDAQMGDMSGLQVCEALKADAALADIPIIFVSSHQEPELEVAVLKMGAVDFIRKPFDPAQVTARVQTQLKLKRLADDLRRLSRVDLVTGVGNEAAYLENLMREGQRARRSRHPLSLVLVEVDFFESFEALYDRKAAEASLASVAESMRRSVRRGSDFVARLERDRFALILPETPAEGALHVANAALGAIEALDIAHQGSPVSRHLTCSAGVACFDASLQGEAVRPEAIDSVDALADAAAAALDRARAAGRAQVSLVTEKAAMPGPGPEPD
ncbi:GGDEF domain-containing response regulator [Variovorax sp. PBL-E5]|uniref:GGDEF domain-containing response regulator n=1 Tax=Variovorax sp. PBL-E5 TaxID=434014 RepID=UPI0013164B0F|nr:response regulator [Variovorax sp. PBL-E5]VTU26542.1 Bacteriophytochrome cph2 [Variovorax sp. PBL-E5]